MASELNLIYYGPPGTGKTYTTAEKAVAIIDNEVPPDRAAVMARFAELRAKGLIELVTFHQSYSYEEFVEGIRPTLDDAAAEEGSEVRYECRQGIFRRLCGSTDGRARRTVGVDFDPKRQQVWKMSLGNSRRAEDAAIYEECIEKGYLLLGYGRGLDYTGCDTREQILAKLRTKLPNAEETDYNATAVHAFKNEMKVGDLVVISHGNHLFRAIARVTGPYQRLRDSEYGQRRPVEWLLTLDESEPCENIINRSFSQATIYKLKPAVLHIDKLRERLSADAKPSNRVLIIDEINRGNIAKILGELITLLEPSKRRGAPDELSVTLPYSGHSFTVPANVYVIGTMNTADRSIALLDTAIRRRFRFIELEPDPAVIRKLVGDDGVIDGVDVARLLEILNDRIELLYDRDHRLGHAYFLEVKDLDGLRDVLVQQVVPLLQEYFHDHWERICLVLGCPHQEDGRPLRGAHPVIRATALRAEALLGNDPGAEDRLRYEIPPELRSGSGAALRPFFESILRSAKQPAQEPAQPTTGQP